MKQLVGLVRFVVVAGAHLLDELGEPGDPFLGDIVRSKRRSLGFDEEAGLGHFERARLWQGAVLNRAGFAHVDPGPRLDLEAPDGLQGNLCLADGDTADAQPLGEFPLAWKAGARGERALVDEAGDLLGHRLEKTFELMIDRTPR